MIDHNRICRRRPPGFLQQGVQTSENTEPAVYSAADHSGRASVRSTDPVHCNALYIHFVLASATQHECWQQSVAGAPAIPFHSADWSQWPDQPFTQIPPGPQRLPEPAAETALHNYRSPSRRQVSAFLQPHDRSDTIPGRVGHRGMQHLQVRFRV